MDAEKQVENNSSSEMWNDLLLQAGIALLVITMFLFLFSIPQKLFSKLRFLLTRSNLEAKRHFVNGAQLLAQARSSSASDRSDLLNRAVSEADKAVALDPKDAAAHILKALVLEQQGFNSSALDSLDAALSPLAIKSLSEVERSDAFCKRAELKMASGRIDSAESDLVESVRLNGENAKAFGLLGECYEKNGGKKVEAQKAYQDAVRIQPGYLKAQEALDRLLSSSS